MPAYLAQRMSERLAAVREALPVPYLRPDGKTQVTVRYEDDRPVEVAAVVVSTQHADSVTDMAQVKADMVEHVIAPSWTPRASSGTAAPSTSTPPAASSSAAPWATAGLTGRKIIVDTYGGMGRHGGGAFSGKDCTKVDRSAAYAARWVAKNVVAAGAGAHAARSQLAYAIGVARPLSVMVDTPRHRVRARRRRHDRARRRRRSSTCAPAPSSDDLDLRRPVYRKTAAYGHFGRERPGLHLGGYQPRGRAQGCRCWSFVGRTRVWRLLFCVHTAYTYRLPFERREEPVFFSPFCCGWRA